jgi:3-dehydroquinate synthase
MTSLTYKIAGRPCRIVVGSSLGKTLSILLRETVGNGRLFVLCDANVFALYHKGIEKQLSRFSPMTIVVPSGESTKSASQANGLQSWLIDSGISRNDFVLAIGGGVTTDIAGYVASTVLRGVRWGAISTTLLGMVDAALGGKTGINHSAGKNLIGTFWQPSFVVCDTDYLHTLPAREYRAAYGELLKYAALTGGKTMNQIIRLVTTESVSANDLKEVIVACVQYKMAIVKKDERETGSLRMRLNLGHTFAHAIENTLGYGKLLHGEAVTLGLFAAAELSRSIHPTSLRALNEWQSVVKQVMTTIPKRRLDPVRLLNAMQSDKKRIEMSVRFVLLDRPGKPIFVRGIDMVLVRQALTAMMVAWEK